MNATALQFTLDLIALLKQVRDGFDYHALFEIEGVVIEDLVDETPILVKMELGTYRKICQFIGWRKED